MKLKYDGKYFIGAIKFFDRNKDFGFIASNNCGMPGSKPYIQDFYINSSSFVDGTPLLEEAIVVFQIEKQNDRRLRAVNVRRISKSDEDVRLAETYFGEHEKVSLSNNPEYNLFSSSNKYLLRVAALHVLNVIENDDNRSPKKTFDHFTHFINLYRTQKFGEINLYVFDSDFLTEDKQIWAEFFDNLTSLEILNILERYPSVVIYINEQEILNKWIDSLKDKELSLETIQTLQYNLSKTKEPAANQLREIIDKNVLRIADSIVEEFYRRGNTREALLRAKLLPLTMFSEFDPEEIIKRFKLNRLLKEFQSRLTEFKSTRYASYDSLIKAYENLPDEYKTKHIEDVEKTVRERVNDLINNGECERAFSIIEQCDFFNDQLTQQFKQQLFTHTRRNVLNKIDGALNDERILESLINAYSLLKRHYEFSSFVEITEEIEKKLLKTESLFVLSKLLNYDLITKEAIQQRAIDIINVWDNKQIIQYFNLESEKPFEHNKEVREAIINKSFEMISSYSLYDPFNGDSKEEYRPKYYSSIERENCEFLKSLRDYSNFLKEHPKYRNYIKSRTPEEKILLYRLEVIKNLDEDVIQELINGISLKDAYAESDRWYNPPALKNEFLKQILKQSSINLCDLIGNRIAQIEASPENVPLIVFLLEIMSINKPEKPSYYEERDWNNSFNAGLQRITNNNSNNAELKTILWALYFQNNASEKALKDLFSYFPPYIQIRAVKKLFQLISQGRLNKTAESLYDFLGGDKHPLCFPLEITFEYLKVRTENPNATLDNNIMLRLIDGRDDHNEWIGIRQLLHNCKGRYYIKEDDNWREDRYYNGVAWKKEEETETFIYLYVPRKMCDARGDIKEYNNKYYNQIIQFINFNFSPNTFVSYNRNNAEFFKFEYNNTNHIEILNLARSFNIRYASFRNRIRFECNNDDQLFCEARMAIDLDYRHNLPFYWCASKPCLRAPVRYRVDEEWEYYTILDFMRILNIPADYVSVGGKVTKFGHYIILNSFMLSFYKFYEHLQCRECKNLMKPCKDITNFHTRAVNKFICADENCPGNENVVYLNHCFNNRHPQIRCNATIDSRDSKQCPNEQYICPECGACCSTENFKNRIANLQINGGDILPGLRYFVDNDLGHWEKHIFFCYKCGTQMQNGKCPKCNTKIYRQI